MIILKKIEKEVAGKENMGRKDYEKNKLENIGDGQLQYTRVDVKSGTVEVITWDKDGAMISLDSRGVIKNRKLVPFTTYDGKYGCKRECAKADNNMFFERDERNGKMTARREKNTYRPHGWAFGELYRSVNLGLVDSMILQYRYRLLK